MKHGEKFFSIEENQRVWDKYFDNIIKEWVELNREELQKQTYSDKEKAEKIKKLSGYSEKGKDDLTPYMFEYRRKRTSIQQYKPIVLEFEKYINKSFNDISASDLEEFIVNTNKKNKVNHLKGFLQECISAGLIKVQDDDFLILLLPKEYRHIGKLLTRGKNKDVEYNMNSIENKRVIKCPFCGKEKEALVDNWMLIRYKGELEKYLTCRECEGEDDKENNKNI